MRERKKTNDNQEGRQETKKFQQEEREEREKKPKSKQTEVGNKKQGMNE